MKYTHAASSKFISKKVRTDPFGQPRAIHTASFLGLGKLDKLQGRGAKKKRLMMMRDYQHFLQSGNRLRRKKKKTAAQIYKRNPYHVFNLDRVRKIRDLFDRNGRKRKVFRHISVSFKCENPLEKLRVPPVLDKGVVRVMDARSGKVKQKGMLGEDVNEDEIAGHAVMKFALRSQKNFGEARKAKEGDKDRIRRTLLPPVLETTESDQRKRQLLFEKIENWPLHLPLEILLPESSSDGISQMMGTGANSNGSGVSGAGPPGNSNARSPKANADGAKFSSPEVSSSDDADGSATTSATKPKESAPRWKELRRQAAGDAERMKKLLSKQVLAALVPEQGYINRQQSIPATLLSAKKPEAQEQQSREFLPDAPKISITQHQQLIKAGVAFMESSHVGSGWVGMDRPTFARFLVSSRFVRDSCELQNVIYNTFDRISSCVAIDSGWSGVGPISCRLLNYWNFVDW